MQCNDASLFKLYDLINQIWRYLTNKRRVQGIIRGGGLSLNVLCSVDLIILFSDGSVDFSSC